MNEPTPPSAPNETDAKPQVSSRLIEMLKFGAVGGTAFVVHNIFFLLVNGPLGWGATAAKAIALVFSTLVSYIGNRSWTFAKSKSEDVREEGGKFIFANGLSFAIEWLPLGISHYLLGFQTGFADWFSGVIIGNALGMVFRYLIYRKWVFNSAPAKY